jgi:hypothetical protein
MAVKCCLDSNWLSKTYSLVKEPTPGQINLDEQKLTDGMGVSLGCDSLNIR